MGRVDDLRESGRPIVASVSGGKDSTAMALRIRELGLEETNPVYYCYADTHWENAELTDYLERVVKPLLGERFHSVTSKKFPGGMSDLVTHKGAFASRKMRFCTDELKKKPIRDFIREVNERHGMLTVNAVGIRAAESKARSSMLEWEPGSILGAKLCEWTWRPLITWTVDEVVAIHTKYNIAPCSLYLRDVLPSRRIGCWPCLMSVKSEIKAVALTTPEKIDEIRELEKVVAERATERLAKRGETFESLGLNKPTFFQAKDGSGECWPIDKVVQWSKTVYGGKQYELFVPANEEERGCQMWGLCDIPDEKGDFDG
jgi:3'-phosphoadenosine 5'-phosphosulfate sulfotransferase (PAPS reductase)/FAD synthetase